MLSKDGVREALSQMGLDSSEGAVNQIFRTANRTMQTSPKSFSTLVGKMKQEKSSADAQAMGLMRAQHEQALQSEQSRHRREMDALARRKDAEAMVLTQAVTSQQAVLSPGGSSGSFSTALVPIDNMADASSPFGGSRGSPRRSSPNSYANRVGGSMTSSTKKKKQQGGSGYGYQGTDPSPSGFMSPVTYNRKFNQLVHDMEVQTQLKVDEALRDQRDRHADALERVVAEKEGGWLRVWPFLVHSDFDIHIYRRLLIRKQIDTGLPLYLSIYLSIATPHLILPSILPWCIRAWAAEAALRLSELSRELEARHSSDMESRLSDTVRTAEQQRMVLLQTESSKIEELMGEAELFKVNTEAELVEKTEEFKRTLEQQLGDQREVSPPRVQELDPLYIVQIYVRFVVAQEDLMASFSFTLFASPSSPQSHSEELRRALVETETRAANMREAVITEKDKQFAAEKVNAYENPKK